MACVIEVTRGPVRVTAAGKQPLRLAMDVSAFDELDLCLVVFDGTNVASKIITSMEIDDDTVGWVVIDSFAVTSATGSSRRNFTGLLRYIRWEVTSSGTASFIISGIGRAWT